MPLGSNPVARSRFLLSSIRNGGKLSLCHFSLQRRAGWILRTWQTSFCKGGCQGPDPLAASEILYDFHFSLGIHQCAVRDQYMPYFQRRTSRSCDRQDPELLAATNPLVNPFFLWEIHQGAIREQCVPCLQSCPSRFGPLRPDKSNICLPATSYLACYSGPGSVDSRAGEFRFPRGPAFRDAPRH